MDGLELVRQGGLVLVVALQTIVIRELWRRLREAQDARLDEMRKLTEALMTQTRLFETLEKAVEELSLTNREDRR